MSEKAESEYWVVLEYTEKAAPNYVGTRFRTLLKGEEDFKEWSSKLSEDLCVVEHGIDDQSAEVLCQAKFLDIAFAEAREVSGFGTEHYDSELHATARRAIIATLR